MYYLLHVEVGQVESVESSVVESVTSLSRVLSDGSQRSPVVRLFNRLSLGNNYYILQFFSIASSQCWNMHNTSVS